MTVWPCPEVVTMSDTYCIYVRQYVAQRAERRKQRSAQPTNHLFPIPSQGQGQWANALPTNQPSMQVKNWIVNTEQQNKREDF